VAVLLGGPTRDFRYEPAALGRLAAALQSLGRLGAGLMITPSRRTPAAIAEFVRDATEGTPRIFWDGTARTPIRNSWRTPMPSSRRRTPST
jgi:mitochondrial fission protein ELM1